jgi:hypothetical protein
MVIINLFHVGELVISIDYLIDRVHFKQNPG